MGRYFTWLHDSYGYKEAPEEKEILWRTHCLLQFLSQLNVIEYNQFYESIYEIRVEKLRTST